MGRDRIRGVPPDGTGKSACPEVRRSRLAFIDEARFPMHGEAGDVDMEAAVSLALWSISKTGPMAGDLQRLPIRRGWAGRPRIGTRTPLSFPRRAASCADASRQESSARRRSIRASDDGTVSTKPNRLSSANS